MSSESDYEELDFDTRNFIDDMRDPAIRSLALRPYDRRNELITSLINKHGKVMSGIKNDQLWAIGRYCQHLIESGVVEGSFFPTKEGNVDTPKHENIVHYYSIKQYSDIA